MQPGSLHQALIDQLEQKYGSLLCEETLRRTMGYVSAGAFRRAILRDAIPFPVFKLPKRRGQCALTLDVANWLINVRATENALKKKR